MTKLRITLDVETQKQLEKAGMLKANAMRDCKIRADYEQLRASKKSAYDCYDLLAAKYSLSLDRVKTIIYTNHTQILTE